MRVLLTNNTLNNRAGSELYVRDVANALLRRGHTPIAYSTLLGNVAREIREATIPVIDNLDALSVPPDIIHGQHHLDTMTALLRFPGVPAVYFCHGWVPWEEAPPSFPRILRYVAVDHPCRDRLLHEHAIPEEKVRLILNFVDLERFKPRRDPLPPSPQRALFFSNFANEASNVPIVREACSRHGIELDVIGLTAGNVCERPEEVLGHYDLVFARGRAALEALAVGAAVVVCGVKRVGPMVTTGDFDELRVLNVGLRAFRVPMTVDAIDRQIARYDSTDAAAVSARVRAEAGLDDAVDQIISLYREVMAENSGNQQTCWNEEAEAASRYLRWLSTTYKAAVSRSAESVVDINKGLSDLEKREHQLQLDLAEKEVQLEAMRNTLGWRLMNQYGPIKYRFILPAYRRLTHVLKKPNEGDS